MEKKIRFNFVDVIIVAIVAVVFVFGINFIKKEVTSTQNTPKVSFTMEVKCVPSDYSEKFKVGDKIRDAIKGDTFGVVTGIEAKPATELVENVQGGGYSIAEYEGMEDVYITIEGTPTAYGADIVMAQQKIKVGQMVYIKNTGAVGRGYVVDMEIADQEVSGK